jgi:hypothetical protein
LGLPVVVFQVPSLVESLPGCLPKLVLPIFLIGLSTMLFRFFKKSCLLILFSLFVFIVGGFLLLYFLSNNYLSTSMEA